MELTQSTNKKNVITSFIRILLISICIFILIILPTPSYAQILISHDWQEVNPTKHGRQWWDKENIINKTNNKIRISSKFKPFFDTNTDYYLYVMDIDCNQKLYKDISINGNKVDNKEWQGSHGDILIGQVIDQSCALLPYLNEK